MINPDNMLKTYLLNGGSNQMAVDGSTTPVTFSYTVPDGKSLEIGRLIIFIDGGTAFSPEEFGSVAALAVGVHISAGGHVLENWRDNIDIVTCMFDTPGRANLGKSTTSLSGRWTPTKETNGEAMHLKAGQQFSITIRDDLSALTHFRAKLGGRLI